MRAVPRQGGGARVTAEDAVRAVLSDPSLLTVVAQPLVDLTTGGVAGYEALARVPAEWDVAPDRLFAAAHRLGGSAALQAHVCEAVLRLLPELPGDTFLTVNVDPGDLVAAGAVAPLLARRSLTRLVVEITEHAWPDDTAPVDEVVARLRAAGALVAADDVGAGYAGLHQLMRLRPDMVKVDRGLVRELGDDPAAELLVQVLGELCSHLDAWVVVEGVETETQLAALARLGVPIGQGWLLGRPAAPWAGCADPELVRRRARMARVEDTVASLLDTAPLGHVRDDVGTYWLLGDDGAVRATVMAPSTPVVDAAQRAVARGPRERWSPLLVTSRTGEVLGHVRVESLVTALARAAR
ncbi:EAL domain-containing protein [Aquipuribacter sp. SD81]|uniref:EAL domain-containing protein n=1 Tax=Aquipuribacter sp. SD81 TaxID=3127703 RepID=UPI003016B19A